MYKVGELLILSVIFFSGLTSRVWKYKSIPKQREKHQEYVNGYSLRMFGEKDKVLKLLVTEDAQSIKSYHPSSVGSVVKNPVGSTWGSGESRPLSGRCRSLKGEDTVPESWSPDNCKTRSRKKPFPLLSRQDT